MKPKVISALLVLVLILGVLVGLTACNNKESESSSNATIDSYEESLKKADSKVLAKLTNAKEFTKFMQELAGSPETYTSSDIEEKYESLLEDTEDFENYKVVKTYSIEKEKDLEKLEIDNGNIEAMIEELLDLDFINKYSIYVLKVKVDDRDSYDYVVLNKDNEIVFSELLSTATMHISGSFAPSVSNTESALNPAKVDSRETAVQSNNLDQIEIQMFNSQFATYQGKQIGSNVKQLLDKLVVNNAQNQDAKDRIPAISFVDSSRAMDETITNSSSSYASEVAKVRQSVAEKHYYTVDFEYNSNGLISQVNISY